MQNSYKIILFLKDIELDQASWEFLGDWSMKSYSIMWPSHICLDTIVVEHAQNWSNNLHVYWVIASF